MEFIKKFLGIPSDPYETSQWRVFFKDRTCHVETRFGYKVPFHLAVMFEKVDHRQFKDARMLREESQWAFFDKVLNEVVLPRMTGHGRFVRLFADRPTRPALCKVITDNEGVHVAGDVACSDMNQEFSTVQFTKLGCKTLTIRVAMKIRYPSPDDLAIANYNHMKKLFNVDAIENSEAYGAAEEGLIVALARREIETRRTLAICQSEGTHDGRRLRVSTRIAGQSLQIEWVLKDSLNSGEKVLGYRREGGYAANALLFTSNGECVVDAVASGTATYNVRPGTEYFFSFFVRDEALVGYSDMVRFTVRMPTEQELHRFDALISHLSEGRKLQDKKLNPKTSAALETVQSFVEFDESVSEMEKEMIARIQKGSYSDEEKEDKIERLKSVIESLRIEHQ